MDSAEDLELIVRKNHIPKDLNVHNFEYGSIFNPTTNFTLKTEFFQ